MSMNMAYDMIISPRTEHDNKQFHDGRTYTHQLTYKLIVWGGGSGSATSFHHQLIQREYKATRQF